MWDANNRNYRATEYSIVKYRSTEQNFEANDVPHKTAPQERTQANPCSALGLYERIRDCFHPINGTNKHNSCTTTNNNSKSSCIFWEFVWIVGVADEFGTVVQYDVQEMVVPWNWMNESMEYFLQGPIWVHIHIH